MFLCNAGLVFVLAASGLGFTEAQLGHDDFGTPLRVTPSEGGLVPLPQIVKYGQSNLSISESSLQFSANVQEATCPNLFSAIDRCKQYIFGTSRQRRDASLSTAGGLTKLDIKIGAGNCNDPLSSEMNENYTITISEDGSGQLNAPSIYGALRGLETFSQLTFTNSNGQLQIRTAQISDYPRFAHRGTMLDTSRHYLKKEILMKHIELMAQNKFNVLHWHIVDSVSFPYQSQVYPALSGKGAYSPSHVYSAKDIGDIIAFAAARGIRVVPEFDTPGHSTSWGLGQPGLLTKCYSAGKPNGQVGPIDPSNAANYDFLLKLFTEILKVFPDEYVHLGGDEVPFSCWLSNPEILGFMESHNLSSGSQLEQYYIQQLLALVQKARSGSVDYIVWQEVFDNSVKVNPRTIIEEWKGPRQAELAKITKAGLKAITASCWYLNYISYGIDWPKYYKCDPRDFNGTAEQKSLVMGGEVCMWGEYVDGTNVISRTWPRASSVGERLWSNEAVKDPNQFAPRLEEHRCRMLKRGFQVEPGNGPGFCATEWPLV